jgi:hypothetical protein
MNPWRVVFKALTLSPGAQKQLGVKMRMAVTLPAASEVSGHKNVQIYSILLNV